MEIYNLMPRNIALLPQASTILIDHQDNNIEMDDRPLSIFAEIERELLDSAIYRILSAKLQETWGKGVEKLLRRFGQEVIQLTQKYLENINTFQATVEISHEISQPDLLDDHLAIPAIAEINEIDKIDEIDLLRKLLKEGSPKHSFRDVVNSENPGKRLKTMMTLNQIIHDCQLNSNTVNNHIESAQKVVNTIPLPELKISPEQQTFIHVLPDGMGMTVEVGEHLKSKNKPRLSQAEKLNLALAEQRQEFLERIAQEFRRSRLNQGLSLEELHLKTFVPLHHIAFIENGEWEKLPEDIYVKGFIHRLGDVLGFDGKLLANNLPMPNKGLHIPSLVAEDDELDFNLHPLHLYVGYAALMAGAVGGVGWLSQQSQPSVQNPIMPNTPGQIIPSQRQSELMKSSHDQKSLYNQTKNLHLAPPEVI